MINFINPYQTEVLLCLNRFYLLFMVSLPCSLNLLFCIFSWDQTNQKKYPDYVSVIFSGQGLLYVIDLALFGETLANMSYPLIVHFPLVLFLSVHYKYPLISSAVSVFFCLSVLPDKQLDRIIRFGNNRITVVLLFCADLNNNLNFCPSLSICISIYKNNFLQKMHVSFPSSVSCHLYITFLIMLPQVFNFTLFGNKAVVEFMGFAFCIAYLVFLIIYFQEYEKDKQEITQYSNFREMQLQSMQKEIDQVKISSQKLAILRHDMRHHLSIILTQLQNGHPDKAQEYIHEINSAYDDTIIAAYSGNEMLNSVISIYDSRFTDRGFSLDCNISTGKELPCSDLSFCTILSNALENSMHALEQLESPSKWARLTLSQKKNHILFQLENP